MLYILFYLIYDKFLLNSKLIDTPANKKAFKDKSEDEFTSIEKMTTLLKEWADKQNYPKENFVKI